MKILQKDICLAYEDGCNIIMHQVNCQGVMGSGVALAIRHAFPKVYKSYKLKCNAAKEDKRSLLGNVQTVAIPEKNIVICNIFSQFGYGTQTQQTDYDVLKSCLLKVNNRYKGRKIAVPYLMSCVRGGGNWDVVLPMILDCLKDCGLVFYKL